MCIYYNQKSSVTLGCQRSGLDILIRIKKTIHVADSTEFFLKDTKIITAILPIHNIHMTLN